jgi:hypothetical protein
MQKEDVDATLMVHDHIYSKKYLNLIVEFSGTVMPAAVVTVFVLAGTFLYSSKKTGMFRYAGNHYLSFHIFIDRYGNLTPLQSRLK